MKSATLIALLRLASQLFPGRSPGSVAQRIRFVRAGLRERALVSRMISPEPGTPLDRIMTERPQLLGALLWPYQCAAWEAHERLDRIIGHYEVIQSLPELEFSIAERLILADLDTIHSGMRLVLDQPEWFLREGGLALNLFLGDFRAYSVAFSFMRAPGGAITATIGGIQGRNREGMLETYREITSILHGLRPRDFLIEGVRILCRSLQVDALLAVSEAARHQQHAYFRGKVPVSQNYDVIWQDRGGVPVDPQFFDLPIRADRRDLADIKPNKRQMYRRRFAFLDGLEADIARTLPDMRPVRFADS